MSTRSEKNTCRLSPWKISVQEIISYWQTIFVLTLVNFQKNHKKQMNRDMEPQEQKRVILGPRAHKVQGNRVRKEKDLIKRETRGQIWP